VAFIPILSAIPSEAIQLGDPFVIPLKYNKGPDGKRNQARQECSHAHQAIFHPNGEELLVPNLGTDEVCRFKKTDSGKWTSVSESMDGDDNESGRDIQYKTGGGPRHVVFFRT
jgi:6-phosphogluconolactonase (cycloisomerase 2 family)